MHEAPARVLRFTLSERAFHWLVAVAFFCMLITGMVMGKRGSFHDAMYAWHLASAGLLVVGLAATSWLATAGRLRGPDAP